MPAARILVVDDEEWNRDLCSRRLERNGFLVRTASSGHAAFEALEHHPYDLLLLDQMMPEMCGLEILKRLRQEEGAKDLAIIMLTAEASGLKIAEALEAGADDYIIKPVDFPAALARIRTQLDRRQAGRDLKRREERLALASQSTIGGLWEWNFKTGAMYFAPQWKRLLGFEEEDIGSEPKEWIDRIHAGDRSAFQEVLERHLTGEATALDCQQRMRRRDGTYHWMSVRGMSERDKNGEPLRIAGVMTDIHDKATLDPLTGLWNRATWMERLQCCEDEGTDAPLAVLLLNVDDFKVVNESVGQDRGDQLLDGIARRLQEACVAFSLSYQPAKAMPSRTEVDEFAVLIDWTGRADLPGEDRLEAVRHLVKEIMAAVRLPLGVPGQEVYCTACIGVAAIDGSQKPPAVMPQRLRQQAVEALRSAKLSGRDRWVFYEADMLQQAKPQQQVESDLRRALQTDEIVVFYQPRVRIADGVICGFEALARWQHPERGLIAPNDFIPIAEDSGLIVGLGKKVLREACRQMAAWQIQFGGYPQLDVAVNLSPRQCQEPDLVADVTSILVESGLAPGKLHLELTESMLLRNFEEAKKVLLALKCLGVGLKVDDFGTGYSSLRYLSELPFDTLKIDRCFILALGSEPDAAQDMVQMILTMASHLHLEAIAEGVERPEQLNELRRMGCDYAQGYYFSPPVEPAEIERMLREPLGEEALSPALRYAAWDRWNHRLGEATPESQRSDMHA